MARNGKIARLPVEIRDELNERLQNGEEGGPLLKWLNGRKVVVEVLETHFDGVPIDKHSLSQWRLGGYEDWLRHEEARAEVRQLAEESSDLKMEADDASIADLVCDLLAVELSRLVHLRVLKATDPEERWKGLQEVLPLLAQFRRAEHRAARLRMDRERWQLERNGMEREQEDERSLKVLRDIQGLQALKEAVAGTGRTEAERVGQNPDEEGPE